MYLTHLDIYVVSIVVVKYQVELLDGTVVAKSPDEGIEFCVEDGILLKTTVCIELVSIVFVFISKEVCIGFLGHLCAALPLAVETMRPGEKAKLIVQPQCMW